MSGDGGGGALTALLHVLLDLLLVGGLFYLLVRYLRLRRRHDLDRREKEIMSGFLHDVSEAISESETMDADAVLKRVLFYALRTTRASSGAVYLFEGGNGRLAVHALSGIFPPLDEAVSAAEVPPAHRSRFVEERVRVRTLARGQGVVGAVADRGTPILVENASFDPRVPRHEPEFLQVESLLCVPLRFHHELLGAVAVCNRTDALPFTQNDLHLLQALADQASAAIHYAGLRTSLDEKKRLDRDLDVAREIQRSLLPREIPRLPGVDIAAFNEPAQAIGGDYYDFIRIDDAHLGIAIADVAGKGVAGAMLMSVCRSVLRAHAPSSIHPAEVLRAVNRVMSADIAEDLFVTILYMVLHIDTRELSIARAGHERPMLFWAGQTAAPIDSPGVAIGLMPAAIFDRTLTEVTVPLREGDLVVAYTDGITEALSPAGREWGADAFLDATREFAPLGPTKFLEHVRARLRQHAAGHPQSDDMTLLAIGFTG